MLEGGSTLKSWSLTFGGAEFVDTGHLRVASWTHWPEGHHPQISTDHILQLYSVQIYTISRISTYTVIFILTISNLVVSLVLN